MASNEVISKPKTSREYTTVTGVAGPLMIVDKVEGVAFGEVVEIVTPSGEVKRGQVLEARKGVAVVQVFEGTRGIDTKLTKVRFTGELLKIPVSMEMLGRIFDGLGRPIDGAPDILAEEYRDISGAAINPTARAFPNEFIQTGIS
ncbi:MAG: V-type ATP synthase subunit B, partial [Deltaproteobacteria bacterium]|nr:V-type ATP synthase subunit B [Deltaproteobacteria bacterium]